MKFPPEAEFLLGAIQSNVDGETAARLAALLQKNLDWSFLLRAASRHRLLPLLHLTLSRLTTEGIEGIRCAPDLIPLDVRRGLQEHYALNLRRNLFLTGQLFRLLDAFETKGILAIPYKGPVLGAFLYGNLGSRQFLDVDVLVAPAQVQNALEVLVAQGFEPPSFWNSTREAIPLELGKRHECALFNPHTQMVLELHWRTQGLQYSHEITAHELRSHLQDFQLQGRAVPTFAPEELLLLLASHGVRHFWWRLQWLCDLGRLLSTQTLDWDKIWRRASASGEGRRLCIGLILASECLGAPLPAHMMARCKADVQAQALATLFRSEWFYELPGLMETERRLLQLLEQENQIATANGPVTTVTLPLSNRALEGAASSPVFQIYESNDEFRQLTKQLGDSLLRNIETPMWNGPKLHFRMRERPQDKLRYLWWKWLAPTEMELESLSLPRSLRHLYVPYRLMRLTVKYGILPRRVKRSILKERMRQ